MVNERNTEWVRRTTDKGYTSGDGRLPSEKWEGGHKTNAGDGGGKLIP